MTDAGIVAVAVPVPRRTLFDYLIPPGITVMPGARVRVPFGRRTIVGIAVELKSASQVVHERLRPLAAVLDEIPLLTPAVLRLLRWAAEYYCYAPGDAFAAALPPVLRRGRALPRGRAIWVLAAGAPDGVPGRGPLANRLWGLLRAGQLCQEDLPSVRARGWLERWRVAGFVTVFEAPLIPPGESRTPPPEPLNESQCRAVAELTAGFAGGSVTLLHGVTGSGKTEVYLEAIATALDHDQQALVLVPEIGLTPQFVQRLKRLGAPVALLHSGLAEGERLVAWTAAYRGEAAIVLGTRSAVFAPLRSPGLIVVDEEHDLSYKQQEGFRYHGRDLAVLRGHYEQVPVVLGSATPSLETLHNVDVSRYRLLSLPSRARAQPLPRIQILDLRRLAVTDGLSPPLLERLKGVHAAGDQALLFLNRRGFAPALICRGCGWIAPCRRCDAHLTWHREAQALRCHHCGAEQETPPTCPACRATALAPFGAGTQRVEAALRRHFPGASIERIDRDTTSRKGALAKGLERAQDHADFLVGTQMLSKGHDFPRVTLVAVLAIDGALQSADFRGPERAAQLLVQVAGRAGRGSRPGEVWIQTIRPDEPLFKAIQGHDYLGFGQSVLAERAAAGYPPFGHLALLHAQSKRSDQALAFLAAARSAVTARLPGVTLFDPVPSLMERRAGWHRAQLLVHSRARGPLHRFLATWLPVLEGLDHRVRWHLDVDPQEIEV